VFLAELADHGRHLDDLDQAGPPGHPPEQPVGARPPPSQVLRRDARPSQDRLNLR
jgi:hypothetical protein